jgi:hypothetical protein
LDIDENMTAQNGFSGSNTGGASNSVPQPEEIFMQNLRAFRSYALSQGAYFDANGWLIFNGRVLTRSDSEYLDQSETASERLLTDEEIQAAFDNLVSYVESYEGEVNE